MGKTLLNYKPFWFFRTNLRQLEYYHQYYELEEFRQKCHDCYLLQGIWFLENNIFDEVVIWRLLPKELNFKPDIVFDVNGKLFIQRFVSDFKDCLVYKPLPAVTFFRGGFPEYCELTKTAGDDLGVKLYCGSGQRITPQHGGDYDKILVEDDRDLANVPGSVPFYKTANPNIFKPLKDVKMAYDICWPCNFTQIDYKGQEWFIGQVGKSFELKQLKILHVGNKPEVGQELCQKYNVKNIEFAGHVTRHDLNVLLNQSRIGLVSSNQKDGSPRVITEILCSGIPLLMRADTRALAYYERLARICDDSDIADRIIEMLHIVTGESCQAQNWRHEDVCKKLSMQKVCELNLAKWRKEWVPRPDSRVRTTHNWEGIC